MMESLFNLKKHHTNVKTEALAGISTFLAMIYIAVVNPQILSATGMDSGAVFVATCVAACIGSIIMGLLANYPIALAPGMGINAFFTFGIVLGMGFSWQVALGCVFWSGILFFLLSVFKARQWIIQSIPASLKYAISIGIGLFLAMIALQNAGIVVKNDATLVSLGNLKSPESLLTVLGFFIISALYIRKNHAAIIIGVLVVTVIAFLLNKVEYQGVFAMPPSVAPTFLQMDILGALQWSLLPVILTLLFVDVFDTSGTLIAVSEKANLLDKDAQLPRVERALLADSSATIAGSVMGTSSTTSYIESSAGVVAGGRTGLTAIVTGLLFLLALFFYPLAKAIPPFATASAILFVAMVMISPIQKIDWNEFTEAAPAALTALMMPLSFSIADGIAIGFISYTLLKLMAGKMDQLNINIWIISLMFVAKFIWL